MRALVFALSLSLAIPVAAAFAEAPVVEGVVKGRNLYDMEGRKLGKINRVMDSGSIQVIHDGRVVLVPAETLSSAEGKARTSLTKADLRKL